MPPDLPQQLAVRAHSHWQTGGCREAPCPLHAPVPAMSAKAAVNGLLECYCQAEAWQALRVNSTLKMACQAA